MNIRAGYERKETYPVEYVLSKIDIDREKNKVKMDFDGDLIKMGSDRYYTFKVKGTSCVVCGLVGRFFAKERPMPKNRTKRAEYLEKFPNHPFHFNLYGRNKGGHEVMMTKDHVRPRSKRGKNHIDNYQPMCARCNFKKGSKYNA